MMDTERVLVGTVRSVTPQRREIRLQPVTAYEYALDGLKWLRVQMADQSEIRCKIETIRNVGANWRIVLAPGVPRETVGKLRGGKAVMMAEELPQKPEGHLALADLIGMQVQDPSGTLLGDISCVYETKANDAFTITRADGGQTTLPVIPEAVLEVDLDARIVYVGDIAPYRVDE